jgi:hypothetical protein
MRWLFHDPSNRTEAAARKRTLAGIDRWWEQFAAKAPALNDLFKGKKKWDLPGWMNDTLQAISPQLMWEYGPAVRGPGYRLVITPESHKELRPLTTAILERAPKIAGWEFYPYRLAEDLDMARDTVEARTGGTLNEVTAEARIGEGNRIDLMFRSPVTEDEDDEEARGVAFVAAESLLGEQALDRWVGAIEVGATQKRARKTGTVALDRLKDTFDALVESIRDRLSPRPLREVAADAKWSLLKLEPEQADDYPEQLDLFVSVTLDVDLWKAMHAHMPFASERFSRCGETFAYVKIDGSEGLGGSKFADRGEIEDALTEALAPDKLGMHIGGGTGVRYSYVDLALTDLARGVEVVRRTLQAGKVPNRTWVLFFDADLCGEWVGVYPESPEPPREADAGE